MSTRPYPLAAMAALSCLITAGPAALAQDVQPLATLAQEAYLKALDPSGGDRFGRTVAISGDTLIVGAVNEDGSARGVNQPPDNAAAEAGAAYVFVRAGGAWRLQAYLKASNAESEDRFGWAVAIADDTVVVGAWGEDSGASGVNGNGAGNSASQAGAAYVFTRSGGRWSQQAYLKPSVTVANDLFGGFVALSGDTIVVTGAMGSRVFVRAGVQWREQAQLVGQRATARCVPALGPQAAVAVSGDTVVIGGAAVCVFARTTGGWSLQAFLDRPAAAGDRFGFSVGLSGDLAIVGAPGAETAYVYERSSGAWTLSAALRASNSDPGDSFGFGVAASGLTVVVGAEGESSVNGAPGNNSAFATGAAYVFAASPGSPVPGGPPGAPRLTGQVAGSLVSLQWSAGAGGLPTTYSVQVSADLAFTTIVFTQSVGGATSISGSVPNGFVAWARIIASNAAGAAISNVFAIGSPGTCQGLPEAPAALQAIKTGADVIVSWTAVPGATSYRIEADVNGAGRVFNQAIGNVVSIRGSDVAPGAYVVRVFASNACGEGPAATVTFGVP